MNFAAKSAIIGLIVLALLIPGSSQLLGGADPAVQNISIYDVSQLSGTNRYTGGDLQSYGLNKTFILNQTNQTVEYRFQFRVSPPSNSWQVQAGDYLRHENLSPDWTANRIWYNISGTEYVGGNFSYNNIYWDTGNGGTVQSGGNMYAKYLIEINQSQSQEFDQRFLVNDTSNSASSTDHHILDLNKLGRLSIAINEPPNGTTLTQNQTFVLNSTVSCSGGECGRIKANSRYNQSAASDTLIPSLSGEPFHTVNSNEETCSELLSGENCTVTWDVNATGADSSSHLLDVNATSTTFSEIKGQDSADTEVEIKQVVLMNLSWSTTDFGLLDPGDTAQPAQGNSNLSYNVSILENSNQADIWIKGSDLNSLDSDYFIGIGNMSFALENQNSSSTPLSSTYQLFNASVSPGSVLNSFYWLDVPKGINDGDYEGSLSFKANLSG